MDPNQGIAPDMSNNEALRRVLNIFMDQNGKPRAGAPGGPLVGSKTLVTRVNATGPLPTLATLLVAARSDRHAGLIRNLDANNSVWFDSNPAVTDATGTTLDPGVSSPYSWSGAIYIYCTAGSPLVEFTEIYG